MASAHVCAECAGPLLPGKIGPCVRCLADLAEEREPTCESPLVTAIASLEIVMVGVADCEDD